MEARPSIGEALALPWRPGGREWLLASAVAAAGVELLRAMLPGRFGALAALLLMFLVWIVAFRIASEVLLGAADGEPGIPGFRQIERADDLAVKHIGLWLLFTLLLAAGAGYGRWTLILAAVVALAVLPAATLLLTLGRSLLDALNPADWVRFAARIGTADYGRTVGLMTGLAAVWIALDSIARALGLPAPVRNVPMLVVWVWALLAWFRFAGEVVHARGAELNLVEADTEPEAAPESFPRDPERLWTEIRTRGGSAEMHAALARQLARGGNRARRLEHGRMHIAALLGSFERPDQALVEADRMLELDPDFSLAQTDSMLALIRAAAGEGLNWLTAKLCRNYLAAFPNSVKCNEVRLIGCEALAEDQSEYRQLAESWYRRLMTAELGEEQRDRLARLAPSYLGAESPYY